MEVPANYAYADHEFHPDPPHQPLYLAKVLNYLRADPSIRRVLDTGCGDGNFAASIAAGGYELHGLDLSDSGVRIAQSRNVGTFRKGSVYDPLTAPFDSVDSFDAIIAIEVVEHLYSPRIFAKGAYDALRPGGRLIVTTPYWGYLKNVVLAITGRLDRSLTSLWDGGHIKHWSRKTLTTLMEEQGFEVIGFEGAGRGFYLWNGMMLVGRKPS
jgi:2-polyprenyl-3-methyl-5-hydroxy-6-metoxy-1,4-benzoquinol methylase